MDAPLKWMGSRGASKNWRVEQAEERRIDERVPRHESAGRMKQLMTRKTVIGTLAPLIVAMDW